MFCEKKPVLLYTPLSKLRYEYIRWLQAILDTSNPTFTQSYDPLRKVTGIDMLVLVNNQSPATIDSSIAASVRAAFIHC